MNPVRKKRLYIVLAILCGVSIAVALALTALQENINLFYTPSQIANGEAPEGTRIRAGGLVEEGSVKRSPDTLEVDFVVTDGAHGVTIRYSGILPDLFREGQGVIAEGAFDAAGGFEAKRVLAKHDERYMPKEVADTLKRNGEWRGEGAAPQATQ